MPSRYDPLYKYLKQLPADQDEVTLTFAELERVLGMALPASARQHAAWWGSDPNHVQANAWLNARFIASPDLRAQQVRFRRPPSPEELPVSFLAWRNGPGGDNEGGFLQRLAIAIRTGPVGSLFSGLDEPMDKISVRGDTGLGYDYRVSVLKDSDDDPAVLVQLRVEVVVRASDRAAAETTGKRIAGILEPFGALRWFPEERVRESQVARGTGKAGRGTLEWARAHEADLIAWATEHLQLLAMGVHGRI